MEARAVIQDPDLFKSFARVDNDFPAMPKNVREVLLGNIQALYLRGQGVQEYHRLITG